MLLMSPSLVLFNQLRKTDFGEFDASHPSFRVVKGCLVVATGRSRPTFSVLQSRSTHVKLHIDSI